MTVSAASHTVSEDVLMTKDANDASRTGVGEGAVGAKGGGGKQKKMGGAS